MFHQADIIQSAKEVTRLQSDLKTQMTLLKDTVHTKTTVPTSHVFVSDFCNAVPPVCAECLLIVHNLSILMNLYCELYNIISKHLYKEQDKTVKFKEKTHSYEGGIV